MNWFFERHKRASEKNGKITFQKTFGRWEVFVGDLHMSSRYLRAVWRDAYKHLPQSFHAKTVLMLGLAAGDNVELLAARFPGCHVIAVEWDPVMVDLADELQLYPKGHRPEIMVVDAREAVSSLSGPFDLILVDVFDYGKVAQAAFSDGFFKDIARLVTLDGFVIANSFRQPELLDAAAAELETVTRWKSQYNRMGIFQKRR